LSSAKGTGKTTTTSASGGSRRRKGASCERCFFGCRGLCALNLGGPCATFRPERPEGLVPPTQPVLLIREPALEPTLAEAAV
jgi:hypothetical protein